MAAETLDEDDAYRAAGVERDSHERRIAADPGSIAAAQTT